MADFKLEDIRAAAEKRFGSLNIELGDGSIVTLRNVLSLGKAQRDRVQALQETDAETLDAQISSIRETIKVVASSEAGAQKLLDMIGDDNRVLVQVMTAYQEQTQVGEASPSQG